MTVRACFFYFFVIYQKKVVLKTEKSKKMSKRTCSEGDAKRRKGDALTRYRNTVNEVADHLLCKITQELPIDPVIALDGHIYERTAINTWFEQRQPTTSPATNASMGRKLVPAHQIRNTIATLMQSGAIQRSRADVWHTHMRIKEEVASVRCVATKGDQGAMEQMAIWYYYGEKGVLKDRREALKWFYRSDSISPRVRAQSWIMLIKTETTIGQFIRRKLHERLSNTPATCLLLKQMIDFCKEHRKQDQFNAEYFAYNTSQPGIFQCRLRSRSNINAQPLLLDFDSLYDDTHHHHLVELLGFYLLPHTLEDFIKCSTIGTQKWISETLYLNACKSTVPVINTLRSMTMIMDKDLSSSVANACTLKEIIKEFALLITHTIEGEADYENEEDEEEEDEEEEEEWAETEEDEEEDGKEDDEDGEDEEDDDEDVLLAPVLRRPPVLRNVSMRRRTRSVTWNQERGEAEEAEVGIATRRSRRNRML